MWDEDQQILARTIYGEARGEYTRSDGGLASLIAVGNVVMNRTRHQKRFGQNMRDVCLKPYQFSCWNKGDPNLDKLMTIKGSDPLFNMCLEVAQHVMEGTWPDLTKGSDHYHATYVAPYWAKGQKPSLKLGRHVFYKLVEG